MAKLFPREALPKLHSTRDTRDRMDIVTDAVPVAATRIRADRIIYHPGDSAAAHYHTDCHHIFYVTEGAGVIHVGDSPLRLSSGDVVVVGPGEVHWFENDAEVTFSFVEFWAPPPRETVWVVPDDI